MEVFHSCYSEGLNGRVRPGAADRHEQVQGTRKCVKYFSRCDWLLAESSAESDWLPGNGYVARRKICTSTSDHENAPCRRVSWRKRSHAGYKPKSLAVWFRAVKLIESASLSLFLRFWLRFCLRSLSLFSSAGVDERRKEDEVHYRNWRVCEYVFLNHKVVFIFLISVRIHLILNV